MSTDIKLSKAQISRIIQSGGSLGSWLSNLGKKALTNITISVATETVKHEIKKQEGGFLGALLAPLAASLVQPVVSSVVKGISGRGVRRAGRGYMDENF